MIKEKDIHVILKDKRYVVFHPESFGLFSVTEDIGELLKSYKFNSNNINLGAERDINNILSHISNNIELNSAKDQKWTNSEPRTLSLLISQDCNLRCRYCYADHGTYGLDEKKLMSYDTAKKCIDKLLNKDGLNRITFFGGEPLLNYALIKKIDAYLNQKKMNVIYSMTTNGTILNDDIKNFINRKVLNLQISLDGPKAINDGQRFGSPESVHDRVIQTIDKLRPRSYPIIIISIVTKSSASNLTEIVEYISSLNIDFLDIKPIKEIVPESKLFINDNDYIKYINELANILGKYIKKIAIGDEVKLRSYIYPILMQMLSKTRMTYGCAAGRDLLTITADGDVYPCHMYIGLNEFHMGNVNDKFFPGDKFNRLIEMLRNINVYSSPYCSECWARYLCGGVCHWQSYITHEDMSRPSERRCMETKTILEALLPEIADIFLDEVKTKNVLNYLKLNKQNKVLTAESQY